MAGLPIGRCFDGLELLIVEIDGIVLADPRTLEAILSESQSAT
jgi:hypothetical protein